MASPRTIDWYSRSLVIAAPFIHSRARLGFRIERGLLRIAGRHDAAGPPVSLSARMVRSNTTPIALLIPVWNRQSKLERALRSLIPEAALLKVVVIDDGSDPPARIDRDLPLDVHLIRLPSNQGIAEALNAGLAYSFAQGIPYIARLDSDDVAVEGRFRKQLALMEQDESIGICGGGYYSCALDGTRIATVLNPRTHTAIRRGMHLRTTLWHPTVMIRTSVAQRVGAFNAALKCEDVEYFLRVLDVARAANLPEPLICYEVGAADTLTGTAGRRRAIARELMQLKLRRPEPLDPLWWLGFAANTTYYLGVNRPFAALGDRVMRLIDRQGG